MRFFYISIRACKRCIREVVVCIVECRRWESHKNQRPPISRFSFLLSPFLLLTRFYFGLLFCESHRGADPWAECIYRRLCDSRNGALKNLPTSFAPHVRLIYAHPCLCSYLIKHGPSFPASRFIVNAPKMKLISLARYTYKCSNKRY